MITDDPEDMERRLTEYVHDARESLETLESIDTDEIASGKGEQYERYITALNKLNTARTWLGIATEQLHDLLNTYDERMREAFADAREAKNKGAHS